MQCKNYIIIEEIKTIQMKPVDNKRIELTN